MIINHEWTFIRDNMTGRGLEIGALHNPFCHNSNTTITYADICTREESLKLFQHRTDFDINKIVNVDVIIKDGAKLPFHDNEFDFVCNSHILEHIPNPVAAIYEWLRVVKQGGYVYFILPDKDWVFDKDRDLTTVEHILKDYENKVEIAEYDHYLDFVSKADAWSKEIHRLGSEIESKAKEMYNNQHSIHVHTFKIETVRDLLSKLDVNVCDVKQMGLMHICVLLQK